MTRALTGCLLAATALAVRVALAPPERLDGTVLVPVLILAAIAIGAAAHHEREARP